MLYRKDLNVFHVLLIYVLSGSLEAGAQTLRDKEEYLQKEIDQYKTENRQQFQISS